MVRRVVLFGALAGAIALTAQSTRAQRSSPAPHVPTIAQFLSPALPIELVAARHADRIAWIANDQGRRNVYTAIAPGFHPVKLTAYDKDDGDDLSQLEMSDDGSVVAFVRGHTPNREHWIADPSTNPQGMERAIWAAKTLGGASWRLAEGDRPVLSPDGRWAAFARDGQIYRVPVTAAARASAVDKGERPLIRIWGTNTSPSWSPDGSKIAFLSSRTDHSFIAVYDVASRTVTYMSPSVDWDTSPSWSPDGRRIAFVRHPGTPFALQSHPGSGGLGNPAGPAYNPLAPPGRGGRGGFPGTFGGGRGDGRGRGADSKTPARPGLTSATFAGGYTIGFWVADVATGEATEVWHNERDDKTFTNINAIRWAGDHLVFSSEPDQWLRYYAVSAASGTTMPIVLTPGDGRVETVGYSSDGRTLYYGTNAGDIDRRHVWKVPTAGGDSVQVTTGEGIEHDPVVVGSGRSIAVLSADAKRPQSVGVYAAAGGEQHVIFPTLPRDFPIDAEVVPQAIITTAADGLEIHNQLFLPKDLRPGERRPAMIFVHGGPIRQMLLGYHYMEFYHLAYAVNQWLASQGYVVMSINYRGGIGYGKSFRTAPGTNARGNSEYQDVLAGAKYLQSRADVDPKRVGIWGLSYGGLLTAESLARNSDIFAAGVDLAGVHLYGSSIDPDNLAYKSSAISAVDTWKSPVLLIQGDDDRNVNFAQMVGLVDLLRAHDVPYELIVLPDDVHETLLHHRWLQVFGRMETFLRQHLAGTTTRE